MRSILFFKRLLNILFSLWLFILAIYFLKKGAFIFSPLLFKYLHLSNLLPAFGLGWLSANLMFSASPISAASMALMVNNQLSPLSTLTVMIGARIGACFIIALVGFIYWFRYQNRQSLMVGLISIFTALFTYLPAYLLAAAVVKFLGLPHVYVILPTVILNFLTMLFEPLVNLFSSYFSAWLMFPVGIALILISLELFEKNLPSPKLQEDVALVINNRRRWRMFGLGVVLVVLTLSMGVTLSLMVPLFQRRFVTHEDIVPVALGANLGNFLDLSLIALLLVNPMAIALIVLIFACLLIVNLFILLTCYECFESTCLRCATFFVRRNYRWIAFLIAMLVAPVLLLI